MSKYETVDIHFTSGPPAFGVTIDSVDFTNRGALSRVNPGGPNPPLALDIDYIVAIIKRDRDSG